MKKFLTIWSLILLIAPNILFAQSKKSTFNRCGAMEHLEMLKQNDPGLEQRMKDIERHTENFVRTNSGSKRAVVEIPVVFHVVYNTAAENLADSFLMSQLDILTNDFRLLNADTTVIPSVFKSAAADTEIEFVIAARDPLGNPTSGITRTLTTVNSWTSDDAVKYTASNGKDAWPSDQYLNFWVCNLSGGLLGYAQFPGGAAATDGVVCNYLNVGNNPAGDPYGLGRTATHEVGHWLNLRHIWGDAACGDDLVGDTPTQQTDNSGCPTFPHVTACTGNAPNGDMFVNYMDYCYDACLVMFTAGQGTRMNAALAPGGPRYAITTSMGGIPPGPCTDPITAGNAQSNQGTVCVGETVSLSLAGATHGTGQTYQWQSSPNGYTWSNMSGQNLMTALVNVNADTYYRCEMSCGASTVQSEATQVVLDPFSISTFPHAENFDNPPLDCGWIVEDVNADGSTWGILENATYANSGTNTMYYSYNATNAANDWVFVPALDISPNNEYRVTLRQRVFQASFPEAMEIWVGSAPNAASMTTQVYNGTGLTNTTYQLRTSSYHQPTTFDQLYFGIKCKSGANEAYLFLDDISVEEQVVCTPGTATSSAVDVDCNGASTGSVNLTPTGGVSPYTFAWSNSSTSEDLTGVAAGTYTVVVTDNSGCKVQEIVTVDEPGVMLASASYTTIKCYNSNNATMRLSAAGGTAPYTYYWNTTPPSTLAEVTNVHLGTYEGTVTDANGCSASKQVVLNQPTNILPFIIQNHPAPGDLNLMVSGGVAPYTYNWSNGASTEDLKGVPPGFYFIYLQDKNSCAKVKVVNLTYPSDRILNQAPFESQSRIELLDTESGLLLYPNPAEDMMYIVSDKGAENIKSYRILNLMGELIKSKYINSGDFTGKIEVPVNELASGMYLIQIEGEKVTTMKFHKH